MSSTDFRVIKGLGSIATMGAGSVVIVSGSLEVVAANVSYSWLVQFIKVCKEFSTWVRLVCIVLSCWRLVAF